MMEDELEANPADSEEVTPAAAQEAISPNTGAEDEDDSEQETDDTDELAKLAGLDTPEDNGEELVEVEYEGKPYKVAPELKDALLRQSDYTKKTMDVAEKRKSVEERLAQLDELNAIGEEARTAMVTAAALKLQLQELEETDVSGMSDDQKTRLLVKYQLLERQYDTLEKQAQHAQAKERETRGQHSAKAREIAAQEASKHIKNFDARRTNIAEYLTSYGEDPEQVLGTIDNPTVWRILDDADIGRRYREQQRKKANITANQKALPIATVGGGKASADKNPENMSPGEMAKFLGYSN